jgi:hypothetical protein
VSQPETSSLICGVEHWFKRIIVFLQPKISFSTFPVSGVIIIIIKAVKSLKYKDLAVEIQRMWNVKTNMIPVIIGATGTILKSFRKYGSNVPGKHEVKELQKTAILGTAHILRKVLL